MGNQILHRIHCTLPRSIIIDAALQVKCGCQGAGPEDQRGARMLHMRICARNIFAGTAESRVRMASFKTPFVASPLDASKSISQKSE